MTRRPAAAAGLGVVLVAGFAVAVPVWGAGDVVVAALSAAGPAYRLPRRRARAIVPDLRAAAEELSTRLGWVGTSS